MCGRNVNLASSLALRLNATHERQEQYNGQECAERTAGIVPPGSAIGPTGVCGDKEEHQEKSQEGT
jgi:hypothetical protein